MQFKDYLIKIRDALIKANRYRVNTLRSYAIYRVFERCLRVGALFAVGSLVTALVGMSDFSWLLLKGAVLTSVTAGLDKFINEWKKSKFKDLFKVN